MKIQKQREKIDKIENDSMINVDVGKLQDSINQAQPDYQKHNSNKKSKNNFPPGTIE